MKYFLFFLGATTFASCSSEEQNLQRETLQDTSVVYKTSAENYSCDTLVVVQNDKMNILYSGIDNLISVDVSGVSPIEIIVEGDNCSITSSNGKYIVHASKENIGKNALVSVSLKGKAKKIKEETFIINELPLPNVQLCGHDFMDHTITQYDLASAKTLSAIFTDGIDVAVEPISFEVMMTINGLDISVAQANNWQLSENQKKILSRAYRGNFFIIHGIRVKMPDGRVVDLHPLVFNVI